MDPYLTLGVPRGCTREEVKEAFRARARSTHPDQGGEPLTFIQLRAAYEQILNDLGRHAGAGPGASGDASEKANASANAKASASAGASAGADVGAGAAAGTASSRTPDPDGPGPARGGYASWIREVADQSRRRRPDPKAVRLQRIGALAVFVLLAANAAVFWSLWEFAPGSPENPVAAAETAAGTIALDEDALPVPPFSGEPAHGHRQWERRPANASDFFIVPEDGTLYLAPLDNGRSRAGAGPGTEFGLITADDEVSSIFKGLPNRPIPNREVNAGPVSAGSRLRFFLKKRDVWAFSDALSSFASFESFVDRDQRLGGGGSIIEQAGENLWILHLDDLGSTDDDDDDIVIRMRLRPNEP